jgi:hypothetical protein
MASELATITGLSDVASWATEDELRLTCMLVEAGQQHLFAGWKANQDADKKHAFYEQVSSTWHADLGRSSTNLRAALMLTRLPPAARG